MLRKFRRARCCGKLSDVAQALRADDQVMHTGSGRSTWHRHFRIRLRLQHRAERSAFGLFEARRKASRPSLVYCGDDESGKKLAAGLIRDVGFDPVDAGPLRIARYTEPFALLVGQLAYAGQEGPELAYRFERFGK